jgi:hypothetical protein
LSALQLRVHYVIYRALRQLDAANNDEIVDLRDSDALQKAYTVFIPASDVYAALRLTDDPASAQRVLSILRVLAREDLIANELRQFNWMYTPGFAFDSPAKLAEMRRDGQALVPTAGMVAAPTPAGIELFLWGCGSDDHDPVGLRMIPSQLVEQVDPPVAPCPGAVRLGDLPRL